MSAQRLFIPAAAGVTAIGGLIYYNSAKPEKSRVEQRRERGQAKRDAGLSGAGVGQTAVTGLHEKGGPGSGVPTANMDPDRAIKTDAPKEKLPSGGVGGGVGAGGANTRKTVDISAKKTPYSEGSGILGSGHGSAGSNSDPAAPSAGDGGSSQGSASWSQSLQSVFSQGGSVAGEKDDIQRKYHDTKIHSNHADTPTKRLP